MNRPMNLHELFRAWAVAGAGALALAVASSISAAAAPKPAAPAPPPAEIVDLLAQFRAGPMADTQDIVFAQRKLGKDGHWYANFGHYGPDPERKAYADGARLCRLNLATGKLTVLLEDALGGVRDPQVHYDGRKILFSYRKGGTPNYLLYEINADGAGLRQLTDGTADDIEPTYLPDGDIVFVSSRCNRFVNCWLTQVAILHRCDANGGNIRAISCNIEHDNTPWPMPDGRLIYTRWEYVDRSQVHFHHLWSSYPDGTSQMTYFGNMHPGITMIDAKPIAGTDKVVASFSPGHGKREHDGVVTVVDPRGGPDNTSLTRSISKLPNYRDPWAFSEECFMAASGPSLVLMDGQGRTQEIFKLSDADIKDGLQCHEPRPLTPRPRERVLQPRIAPDKAAGYLLLADVNHGRNMDSVKQGEIKKLLVVESLPMPVHFTGGMEPISYGGTFTLERILGTVPIEPDGSAYIELPALRSVFFVALDKDDLAVKRMQSFTMVQPGEVTGCVGCHEHRAQTPLHAFQSVTAYRRPPSKVAPISDVPELFDFPRDIQPILNALCTDCHGYEKTARGGPRDGRLLLTGDRGPLYSHSYYAMTVGRLFSDGRNEPRSNYEPRTLGSSASRILTLLNGSHYDVKATPHQKKMLRLWIDAGAAYPGTYAALACGMIGNYIENNQVNTGADWPATVAATELIKQRCAGCHNQPERLLPVNLADERGVSFWKPSLDDPRLTTSRHIVFNLSRPEKSLMLLAPLSAQAGGWGLCRDPKTKEPVTVFASVSDPGYQKLLAMVEAGRQYLDQDKRFDMAGFRPRQDWVRELQRYGILPAGLKPTDPIDVYAVERDYWKSLWYRPRPAVTRSASR